MQVEMLVRGSGHDLQRQRWKPLDCCLKCNEQPEHLLAIAVKHTLEREYSSVAYTLHVPINTKLI